MTDLTLTITVNDWRDVPHDDTQRRREILRRIENAARYAAERQGDNDDIAVAVQVERGE